MKKRLITIFVLTCFTLVALQASTRRVYVKLASDATSWSHITQNAENTIITLPAGSTDFVENVLTSLLPEDEVWVAKGIYNNKGKLTLLNDDVAGLQYGRITLYGGFAGNETSPAQRELKDVDGNGLVEPWEFSNETVFRGAGNDASKASSFQMIQLGHNSVLDGVTISDNYFTGANTAAGGEVKINSLIRKCTIKNLTTEGTSTITGGGLYVTGGKVESCLIEKCASIAASSSKISCYGGGVLVYGIADNMAGVPTGSIKNSVIRNCRAGQGDNQGRGGGVFGKGGAVLENCVINNNTASQNGGAFYFHNNGDANSHVNRVIGCTVVNNCSPYSAFPECDFVEIYNTVIWGNSTTDYPPIDGTGYTNTIRLRNTTNANATAYPYLDGVAHNGTIQNPVNNKNGAFNPLLIGGAFNDISEDPSPEFSKPTEFQGVGLSPVDDEDIRNANWTLMSTSPLIDKGINTPSNTISGYEKASLATSFSGMDILGKLRNVGSFDIGAYEYGATTSSVPNLTKPFSNIYTEAGGVVVAGLENNAEVNVYSVSGNLLNSVKTNSSSIHLPLQAKGVYIVTIISDGQVYSSKVTF